MIKNVWKFLLCLFIIVSSVGCSSKEEVQPMSYDLEPIFASEGEYMIKGFTKGDTLPLDVKGDLIKNENIWVESLDGIDFDYEVKCEKDECSLSLTEEAFEPGVTYRVKVKHPDVYFMPDTIYSNDTSILIETYKEDTFVYTLKENSVIEEVSSEKPTKLYYFGDVLVLSTPNEYIENQSVAFYDFEMHKFRTVKIISEYKENEDNPVNENEEIAEDSKEIENGELVEEISQTNNEAEQENSVETSLPNEEGLYLYQVEEMEPNEILEDVDIFGKVDYKIVNVRVNEEILASFEEETSNKIVDALINAGVITDVKALSQLPKVTYDFNINEDNSIDLTFYISFVIEEKAKIVIQSDFKIGDDIDLNVKGMDFKRFDYEIKVVSTPSVLVTTDTGVVNITASGSDNGLDWGVDLNLEGLEKAATAFINNDSEELVKEFAYDLVSIDFIIPTTIIGGDISCGFGGELTGNGFINLDGRVELIETISVRKEGWAFVPYHSERIELHDAHIKVGAEGVGADGYLYVRLRLGVPYVEDVCDIDLTGKSGFYTRFGGYFDISLPIESIQSLNGDISADFGGMFEFELDVVTFVKKFDDLLSFRFQRSIYPFPITVKQIVEGVQEANRYSYEVINPEPIHLYRENYFPDLQYKIVDKETGEEEIKTIPYSNLVNIISDDKNIKFTRVKEHYYKITANRLFRKGNYELVTSIDGHQLNYQIKVIVDEILENDQYIEENHYDEASSIKVPSFDVDGFDNETILKVVAEDNGVEVKNVTKEMLAQYDMLFFGPENVLQASNLRYYNNLCSKYNVDATAEKVLLVPMDYNFQIDDLKYFPNCEVLYVYNAPEVIDLQNIGKYPKLKTVDIDNSVVENYHALYDLPNLKLLALIGDGIEDISGISKLKDSVELLYLNKNNITNISELSAFSKIKFLNLNENSIEDYTPLYSLTTLQETYTDSTDSNIPGYVKRNPWFGW